MSWIRIQSLACQWLITIKPRYWPLSFSPSIIFVPNPAVALANTLYSASILDLDTVGCFCALQETRFLPRYMTKPHVVLLSSPLPVQSESKNALTSIDFDFVNVSPTSSVCFRYHKIIFTAILCSIIYEWRNWHTLLTEKAKSSRVRVKYCNALYSPDFKVKPNAHSICV
jgi:hypothetical protein